MMKNAYVISLVIVMFPFTDAGSDTIPLINSHGWFVQKEHVIWGWVQHNGWWRTGGRPNITRRSVGEPAGDIRPNRTEDLDALTDSMLRYGYPGFEHNYGLWYDRRRDAHDTAHRDDANVEPPFLEQPWARSGTGQAADGLSLYDLTAFNPWYFKRLQAFADLCDRKGTVLFHKFYMQHALLEIQAHYVDFPWRPVNTIQETGMPDIMPAANAFYDISHPIRYELHRLYIRKCLDTLGENRNVVHLISQEYTGPEAFVTFWLDTILEWEQETGRNVCIGLGVPKDVQESIMSTSRYSESIDVLDLRCWWVRDDGSLYAPVGGDEVPGREIENGYLQGEQCSPERIYLKIREYRDRYPDKAIIDAVMASRQQSWAFLMAGGGMLIRGQIAYLDGQDPLEYIQPADMEIILPTYTFLRHKLGDVLPNMRPVDITQGRDDVWCLASENTLLVYALRGGTFSLRLSGVDSPCSAIWFDPRTGETREIPHIEISIHGIAEFTAPDNDDWALVISHGQQ